MILKVKPRFHSCQLWGRQIFHRFNRRNVQKSRNRPCLFLSSYLVYMGGGFEPQIWQNMCKFGKPLLFRGSRNMFKNSCNPMIHLTAIYPIYQHELFGHFAGGFSKKSSTYYWRKTTNQRLPSAKKHPKSKPSSSKLSSREGKRERFDETDETCERMNPAGRSSDQWLVMFISPI